jgi:hypothetical protein
MEGPLLGAGCWPPMEGQFPGELELVFICTPRYEYNVRYMTEKEEKSLSRPEPSRRKEASKQLPAV